MSYPYQLESHQSYLQVFGLDAVSDLIIDCIKFRKTTQ